MHRSIFFFGHPAGRWQNPMPNNTTRPYNLCPVDSRLMNSECKDHYLVELPQFSTLLPTNFLEPEFARPGILMLYNNLIWGFILRCLNYQRCLIDGDQKKTQSWNFPEENRGRSRCWRGEIRERLKTIQIICQVDGYCTSSTSWLFCRLWTVGTRTINSVTPFDFADLFFYLYTIQKLKLGSLLETRWSINTLALLTLNSLSFSATFVCVDPWNNWLPQYHALARGKTRRSNIEAATQLLYTDWNNWTRIAVDQSATCMAISDLKRTRTLQPGPSTKVVAAIRCTPAHRVLHTNNAMATAPTTWKNNNKKNNNNSSRHPCHFRAPGRVRHCLHLNNNRNADLRRWHRSQCKRSPRFSTERQRTTQKPVTKCRNNHRTEQELHVDHPKQATCHPGPQRPPPKTPAGIHPADKNSFSFLYSVFLRPFLFIYFFLLFFLLCTSLFFIPLPLLCFSFPTPLI